MTTFLCLIENASTITLVAAISAMSGDAVSSSGMKGTFKSQQHVEIKNPPGPTSFLPLFVSLTGVFNQIRPMGNTDPLHASPPASS